MWVSGKFVENLNGKDRRRETTWKILAWMRNNISMDYKEVRWKVVNRVHVTKYKIQCREVVVNETPFPIKLGKLVT